MTHSILHRRRWWIAIVVTAAAPATVVVVVTTSGGTDHSSPPPQGMPGVVPRRPLPLTHPTLPARTIERRSRPRLVDPCDPGDLAISAPRTGAGLGTTYVTFRLTTTHGVCRIAGFPEVVPYDHRRLLRQVQVVRVANLGDAGVHSVAIAPARPATFIVGWANTHDCRRLDNTRLQVLLPYLAYRTGDVVRQPVYRPGFGRTTCNAGEGAQHMMVSPVQSTARPRVVSPYKHLRVSPR